MQSLSVSRNFAQCLDAITLSVMYSFKKAPVTEYNVRTGNSQTPRRKSLKMLGLYLYTLIISHKSSNMLRLLNKLTL